MSDYIDTSFGGKAPPPVQERGANNKLGSSNDALLLVYVTGYRVLGALSKCKDIALSDSVGENVAL